MEIERKWLCDDISNILKEKPYIKQYKVEQFYIVSNDNIEIRFRLRTNKDTNDEAAFITIKNSGNLSREELDIEITVGQYLMAKEFLGNKPPIQKDFYILGDFQNNLDLEFSIVDDAWCYAEVEFETEEAVRAFSFQDKDISSKILRDVTYDSKYKMKNYWNRTRGE